MTTNFVPLSGGWDSAYCLVQAIRAVGAKNVTAIFFEYGQSYLPMERACAPRIAGVLGVKFYIIKLDSMACVDGIFDDRNGKIIRRLVAEGAAHIWFGSRCPLRCWDKYGDSNAQWARVMAKELGVGIETPATLLPKFWIKHIVSRAGITDDMIYSTEAA